MKGMRLKSLRLKSPFANFNLFDFKINFLFELVGGGLAPNLVLGEILSSTLLEYKVESWGGRVCKKNLKKF